MQIIGVYFHKLVEGSFNHPYFLRATNENGGVITSQFRERYISFLDRTPVTHNEARFYGPGARPLEEMDKTILLMRVRPGKHVTSHDAIGRELGIDPGAVGRREHASLRRIGNYRILMDRLYVEEFDFLARRSEEISGFDPVYLASARENAVMQDARIAQAAFMAEHGVQRLGLPKHITTSLQRAGIRTIDDLRGASEADLLRVNHLGPVYAARILEKLRQA